MIYKYDNETLTYKKVTNKWFLVTVIITLLISACLSFYTLRNINEVRFISQETKAIILRESDVANKFSPEKLKFYILELNLRFPHIILAQTHIETGHFTSTIFRENNNLFGMKVATQRPTTNKGEESGHAFYVNWKESVVDYAFYQAKYLSDVRTDKEYLEYLKKYYAEDPSYMPKLIAQLKEMGYKLK